MTLGGVNRETSFYLSGFFYRTSVFFANNAFLHLFHAESCSFHMCLVACAAGDLLSQLKGSNAKKQILGEGDYLSGISDDLNCLRHTPFLASISLFLATMCTGPTPVHDKVS